MTTPPPNPSEKLPGETPGMLRAAGPEPGARPPKWDSVVRRPRPGDWLDDGSDDAWRMRGRASARRSTRSMARRNRTVRNVSRKTSAATWCCVPYTLSKSRRSSLMRANFLLILWSSATSSSSWPRWCSACITARFAAARATSEKCTRLPRYVLMSTEAMKRLTSSSGISSENPIGRRNRRKIGSSLFAGTNMRAVGSNSAQTRMKSDNSVGDSVLCSWSVMSPNPSRITAMNTFSITNVTSSVKE
mmetsp:Transcript_46554/g.111583  ORF Transcript_46554/g.111583 Transcript_46554/m.111583 type:complete len:246 (-) Transcript_46554:692-1429(-)